MSPECQKIGARENRSEVREKCEEGSCMRWANLGPTFTIICFPQVVEGQPFTVLYSGQNSEVMGDDFYRATDCYSQLVVVSCIPLCTTTTGTCSFYNRGRVSQGRVVNYIHTG